MTLISTAEASPLERCDILAELVTTFARVPVAYLRAMSTPIVRLHVFYSSTHYIDKTLATSLSRHWYDPGSSLRGTGQRGMLRKGSICPVSPSS